MILLYNKILHFIWSVYSRYKLKNKGISIISCNCIGGVMYHDLGLPFLSPTINLYFDPKDFLRYVKNLRYYNSLELENVTLMNDYPQGRLDDVLIHFLHYKTFDEAKICWEKRKKRICYDNIFHYCPKKLPHRFS